MGVFHVMADEEGGGGRRASLAVREGLECLWPMSVRREGRAWQSAWGAPRYSGRGEGARAYRRTI